MSEIQTMNADARYYTLLEQLIQIMTDLGQYDVQKLYATLSELCKILRISRGVTSFYENPADEMRGEARISSATTAAKRACWWRSSAPSPPRRWW